MVKKIDIPNFGCFRNFRWSTTVKETDGSIVEFKKLNIIYGRNYSGKTTLSRIFRSLEIGKLPPKYEDPSFSVITNRGTVDHTQIPIETHHIRVYNKDFVDEYLSFLRNSEGQITSFAILGKENKEIEKRIEEKENELGNPDDKCGLRYEYSIKYNKYLKKENEHFFSNNSVDEKLRNKAREIKNSSIYKDPLYDIRKIKSDIGTIRSKTFDDIDDAERERKLALLKEEALPDIEKRLEFACKISDLYNIAKELVEKKITPTKAIQELLDDIVLQDWVKNGIKYHKEKRDRCGLCGQVIPQTRWKELDEHFSKESIDLESRINAHIEAVEKERELANAIITVENSAFYSTFRGSFADMKINLENEIKQYEKMLTHIIDGLQKKKVDIFARKTLPELVDNSSEIDNKIAVINALIEENNSLAKSLEKEQENVRNKLRLNEIAKFIQDIDLDAEEKKVVDLKEEMNTLNMEVNKLKNEITKLETEMEALQNSLRDEKKGADKINEYLKHYFGHEKLKLIAIEDNETAAFKFQIHRGDTPAYNLSEGECSLIAFCYFLARLEDAETAGKHLIIYIDDPVSSLDSDHIFLVYSLIESIIAKPKEDADGNAILDESGRKTYRYEQLFISTHNLDFLKYLKKLSHPKGNHEQFLVIAKEDGSVLEIMPPYLRNYITEFNHLFYEIYICSNPSNASTAYHCFYSFGNNLRKFLEAYLFFKYPFSGESQADYNKRMKMFFTDRFGTDALVQRLTNEYSHLVAIFDRSARPIDCAEISKMAKFVLTKIKENDNEQYMCLIDSIGKPDPLENSNEESYLTIT